MTDYQFTQDWFHWAPQVWEQLTPMLPREGQRHFLEVGSFEGRSMVWIAENMMNPGDTLTCIDTWGGGEEHGDQNMSEVEVRFDHNREKALSEWDITVRKWKCPSLVALAEEVQYGKEMYSFIYIDGSHIAKDVLTDACMAWSLLKPKGFMVFDDYVWGEPRDILHRPKPAIDCFTNLFAEELNIVHVGYQLIIQKKG